MSEPQFPIHPPMPDVELDTWPIEQRDTFQTQAGLHESCNEQVFAIDDDVNAVDISERIQL